MDRLLVLQLQAHPNRRTIQVQKQGMVNDSIDIFGYVNQDSFTSSRQELNKIGIISAITTTTVVFE